MQRMRMDVYRMDNPDGTPRKYWCSDFTGNILITRWGGANNTLQENIKPCSYSEFSKLIREKESKGYEKLAGQYWVADKVDWSGSSRAAVPEVDPVVTPLPPTVAPATKFSNILLHWTASDLDGDWQKVIQDALDPVVADGNVTIQLGTNMLSIITDGTRLEVLVRNKRARGTVEKNKSAWLLSLCLVKLSKHLSMTVVNDDSVVVDRRYLSSRIDTFDVPVEEFDDVAEKLGLIVSKAFVKANPVLANFF